MPGLELIKNLADLDRELAAKVAAARRDADRKIKDAEAEAQRLLAEAEAKIRRLEAEAGKERTEEDARVAEAARRRAAEEKDRLCSQARPHLEQAVQFILSKVLP